MFRCGGSAVHKTRMMAARALSPLVVKHCTKDVLMQLVEKLPQQSTDNCKQNALHGTLLQVGKYMLSIEWRFGLAGQRSPRTAKVPGLIGLIPDLAVFMQRIHA